LVEGVSGQWGYMGEGQTLSASRRAIACLLQGLQFEAELSRLGIKAAGGSNSSSTSSISTADPHHVD